MGSPDQLPPPINPTLLRHAEERAQYEQNRLADRITTFAGSMAFVYLHVLWFGCWIGFGVEQYPFGLLTMIVSLEAIFLSTFVMISQNRADAKRQVLADQQWKTVQNEERENEQLLNLSAEILRLTKEVRSFAEAAQSDHEQNEQLLDLSRRTLALTTAVHAASGAGAPARDVEGGQGSGRRRPPEVLEPDAVGLAPTAESAWTLRACALLGHQLSGRRPVRRRARAV